MKRVADLSRYRIRYHHISAPYSINQPPASLHPSSASSWGIRREASSEDLTSGVGSSDLTSAARLNQEGETGHRPYTSKPHSSKPYRKESVRQSTDNQQEDEISDNSVISEDERERKTTTDAENRVPGDRHRCR